MHRILFVCSGNICRSPTAEGVARYWIEAYGLRKWVAVDSAGTHGYHVGEAPDPRAWQACRARGYDLSRLRARKLVAADYEAFDPRGDGRRASADRVRRQCPAELTGVCPPDGFRRSSLPRLKCPTPTMAARQGSTWCWIFARPA